ncbi:MAG: hypothetical protein Q9175_003036 [Cornicularia normoerica]
MPIEPAHSGRQDLKAPLPPPSVKCSTDKSTFPPTLGNQHQAHSVPSNSCFRIFQKKKKTENRDSTDSIKTWQTVLECETGIAGPKPSFAIGSMIDGADGSVSWLVSTVAYLSIYPAGKIRVMRLVSIVSSDEFLEVGSTDLRGVKMEAIFFTLLPAHL